MVGNADSLLGEDLYILIGDPNAMGGGGGSIQNAQISEKRRWRLSVTGNTFLMLLFGLGQMDLHSKSVGDGILGNLGAIAGAVGVLGVKRKIDLDPSLTRVLIVLDQRQRLGKARIGLQIKAGIKGNQTTGKICLDTGLQHGFCHRILEHIHIRKGSDTVAKHLGNGKLGGNVNACGCQTILGRKDLFLQPTLQGQILAVAAEQGHCRMAMDIVERGHQKISRTIHGLVHGVGDLLCRDLLNDAVVDQKIALLSFIAVFGQQRGVF